MTSGPDDSQPKSPDPFPSFVLQIQYPDFLDPPQPPCLDDATRGQVAQALRDLLSGTFPDAFVDVLCVGADTEPAGRAASFGVWAFGPRGPSPARVEEMRAALRFPIGREHGEMIAFSFSQRFLDTLAGLGATRPGVHVQSAWAELEPPDTVRTRFRGVDERAWPDAHFTLSISERLTRTGGQFDTPEPEASLDVDNSLIHDLFGIGSLFTGSPILAGLGLYQAWKVNEAGLPDDLSGGVLTGIVGNFLAPTIPMPGGQKLELLYDRATVQPDAVQVGGVITGRVARTPLAAIGGRTSITFQPVQSVAEGLFGLVNLDDVLPPLRIAWTVGGQPAGEGSAIAVKFDAPAPGTVEYEDVTVTVTDRDDLTATSTVRVQLVAPLADTDHGHHHGDGNPLQEP